MLKAPSGFLRIVWEIMKRNSSVLQIAVPQITASRMTASRISATRLIALGMLLVLVICGTCMSGCKRRPQNYAGLPDPQKGEIINPHETH